MATLSGFKLKYFLVVILLAILSLTAFADPLPFVEQQKLTASSASSDYFGNALIMDDNTALVSSSDGVYVFVRSGVTWVEQAKLSGSNGDAITPLALDGDTALVQRNNPDNEPRAVYVFVRSGTTWTQQAILTASDPASRDDFGNPAVLDGDMALVSASSGDGHLPGAVYVYTRSGTTWTEQGKFSASDAVILDAFGYSLALDRETDTLLVGAIFRSEPDYSHQGAVYAFKRNGNTWVEQAKLLPAGNPVRVQFGFKVAIDGNTALASAPQWANNYVGAVYVFTTDGTTWTQQTVLTPGDISGPGAGSPNFGSAIALQGDTALVDVPYAPNSGASNVHGVIYEYLRTGTTWTEVAKIIPGDSHYNDYFGISLALEGDTLLANAPDYSSSDPQDAVYIFQRGGTPLNRELLVNGGFEVDSNGDFVPDGWTRKNPTGDGRRCNQAGQPAYEGQCSYLFKDDASGNNKLLQNVDLSIHDLNAGDKVKLTGFYNKQSTGSIQIRLFVTYANLPGDEAHVTLTQTTNGYKAINPLAITLDAKPTRVRVQIQNQTTSGKTWFDGLSLKLTDNSGIAPLIPLPLMP